MTERQLSPDEIASMCVFARVVETGSLTAAAESLSMSKASVSKILHTLEERLSTRLLQRTTRRQSLTEVGKAYYAMCQKMLHSAAAARDEVERFSVEPVGVLKLSAPVNFGNMYMAPLLTELAARYPKLEIDLTLSDQIADLVRDEFDAALRIVDRLDEQLIAKPVALIHWVVCASPSYLARGAPTGQPQDLARHNCLRYPQLAPSNVWPFVVDGQPLAVPVSGSLSINSSAALMSAAIAGAGVVRVPTYLAGPALQDGRLHPLLQAYAAPPQTAYLVYTHGRYLLPKVRVLVEFARQCFGGIAGAAPWDAWRRTQSP
jgi:DNA-binding transcriptional LysR family regulator